MYALKMNLNYDLTLYNKSLIKTRVHNPARLCLLPQPNRTDVFHLHISSNKAVALMA